MGKYVFEFTLYKGDEDVLESSAQVSLSKKDLFLRNPSVCGWFFYLCDKSL